MTVAVIVLSIAAAVLLLLCILQKREMRHIEKQLAEIKDEDTNILIHSGNGTADALINRINTLLKELREMRAVYMQKSHSLEQMMTNISHDLRTPLTSAMGYINMIQHTDLPEEEKSRELAIVEKRLIRLEELIGSFFEFSQIISSGKQPEKTELNLVSVLEESIVHYYDDYCDRGRQIIFHCDTHRLLLSSNQNMLLRIFDNLISNALKHGEDDLTVTMQHTEGIRITFENVLSTPNLDTTHIFDEFYTTDISRTKGNTGLGLAIAKQFTEMLGGSISAETEGTLFRVMIVFGK
ncbi:MAG: HAMP domain-containing histidine kinase [Oscillospiraceae bacterium]|nr:HAMP domain-containing histidine kinase [Oscillospiraceae bacterium]